MVPLPRLSPSVRAFLNTEAGSAALLLAATVAALVWANLPGTSYHDVWATTASIRFNHSVLELDLAHWINDAAMAIFFLVVGLEISREVTVGELRSVRNVAAPALGAVGGLVLPAVLYLRSIMAAPARTAGAFRCRPTRRSSPASWPCSARAARTGCGCSC